MGRGSWSVRASYGGGAVALLLLLTVCAALLVEPGAPQPLQPTRAAQTAPNFPSNFNASMDDDGGSYEAFSHLQTVCRARVPESSRTY